MSAHTHELQTGLLRQCLRAFRACDIYRGRFEAEAVTAAKLSMHHLQSLLQKAMNAQQAALAEGLRFLNLGEHPAAVSYRAAINELSRSIWIDAAGKTASPARIQTHASLTPVFLGGSHKSGTTLLRNLLDGHPEISVLPTDGFGLRFHQKVSCFEPKQRGLAMVAAAVANVAMPIAGEPPRWILGDTIGPYAQIGVIVRELADRDALGDTSSCMRGFADLFHRLSPQRDRARYWAEKSTFNVQDAPLLARLFPKGKFIHIVRHPGAIVAAQKRKQPMKKRSYCLQRECEEVFSSLSTGAGNRKALSPDVYHTIKYEDLLSDPEREMRNICAFLGVAFEECLLKPTVFGQPAGSNTSRLGSSPSDAGKLNTAPGEKWRSELDQHESDLIQFCFGGLLDCYGYVEDGAGLRHVKGALHAMMDHVREAGNPATAIIRWISLYLKSIIRSDFLSVAAEKQTEDCKQT